jgi:dihydroneopterin aldolase
MTDVITITGVRAFGHHGVLEKERRGGQTFVVDVAIHLDLSRSASTDLLDDTVDYSSVAAGVVTEVEGPPCQLIETLAARIARRVLEDRRVERVEVTVHKPQAPVGVPFGDVSVTLVRSR